MSSSKQPNDQPHCLTDGEDRSNEHPSVLPQHDLSRSHRSSSDWPSLAVGASGGAVTDKPIGVEAEADEAVVGEDIGPRTRHRKPRAKPGIPFKVLKARAVADTNDNDGDGDPLAPIAVLPPELLSRIFAHLDARSINQCASVCQAFSSVARDESTWRLAFSLAFGIEARNTPILRRIDPSSWKQEYTRRTELLRQWRKARSATVLCDARVGVIHSIALSLPHNFMLCASLSHGVASRCDPFTGKVAKGFLDASGLVHAVGLAGVAMDPGSVDVSSLCLEADATRIVWGFHSGAVAMTNLARQGTNPRGAIRGVQFSSRASHVGPVLDIAMPFGTACGGAHSIERSPEKIRQRQAMLGEASETFVTCGMDGSVRLWSPKKALPFWRGIAQQDLQASGAAGRPVPVARVAFHVESGTIVAATVNGDLTLWTDIDIVGLLQLPASAYEEPTTFEPTASLVASRKALHALNEKVRRIELPKTSVIGKDGSRVPRTLLLDIEQSGPLHERTYDQAMLLVLCPGTSVFERFTVNLRNTSVGVVKSIFTSLDDDEITCLRPDFDLTRTTSRSTQTMTVVSRPGVMSPPSLDDQTGAVPLYSERKFVCAGTRQGKLVVWDWEQNADERGEVGAWLCLDAHHMSITAIDVTEHAVIMGCSDGTIKAFCPLSGQQIRTFNDRTATRHPARMLAAGQLTDEEASRFHVSQIIAGPETVVASIGSQVLAWRAEKVRAKGNARKATSRTGRNTLGRLWDPKMQSMKEMEQDVYETQQELQREHEERLADRQRLGSRLQSDSDELTEQEAFEYALMLSRDDAEAGGPKGRSASEAADLEDAIEQIARAESSIGSSRLAFGRASGVGDEEAMNDVQDDDGDSSYSRSFVSHSPSPMSSPYIHGLASPPSRAWDILQNAGSSASRNVRVGDAHSKVQAVHVPRTARLSSNSTAASSRRPSQSAAGQQLPMLSSPQNWPSFEPSSSLTGKSPSRLDLGSPVPSARQTSFSHASRGRPTVASTTASPSSSFPSRTSMGAWAQGSPSLRPVNSTSPSALTSSRPGRTHPYPSPSPSPSPHEPASAQPNASGEAMDDDLRFAIELSLAEERSRQEEQRKGKAPAS